MAQALSLWTLRAPTILYARGDENNISSRALWTQTGGSMLPPMFSVLFELRAPNAGKGHVLAFWVTAPKNECGSVPKWPQFSLTRTPDLTKRGRHGLSLLVRVRCLHTDAIALHETFHSSPFHLLCAVMAQLEQELLEFGYSAGQKSKAAPRVPFGLLALSGRERLRVVAAALRAMDINSMAMLEGIDRQIPLTMLALACTCCLQDRRGGGSCSSAAG